MSNALTQAEMLDLLLDLILDLLLDLPLDPHGGRLWDTHLGASHVREQLLSTSLCCLRSSIRVGG